MSSSKSSQYISATKSSLTPNYQDNSLPSQNNLSATDENSLSKFVESMEFPSQLPDAKYTHHDSHQEPCRSNCVNKGIFSSEYFINQVFLSSLEDSSQSYTESQLAYQADVLIDLQTGEIHCTDHHAYAAKLKLHDLYTPTYHEALAGNHSYEYKGAMKIEIRQLIKQYTCRPILQSLGPPTPDGKQTHVLKGT